jgi:hypothetical protein
MDEQWTELESALQSGESDRVNEAIERIEALDRPQQRRLFDERFDDVTACYEASDDGYVRQSVVRVVEQLSPGLVAAVKLENEDTTRDAVERRLDTATGFLLEALQDEDGRVRQSAQRALQDSFRGYRAIDETDTVHALARELEALAEEYDDGRHKHLLESKDDAEHLSGPTGTRLVESIQQLADRADEL